MPGRAMMAPCMAETALIFVVPGSLDQRTGGEFSFIANDVVDTGPEGSQEDIEPTVVIDVDQRHDVGFELLHLGDRHFPFVKPTTFLVHEDANPISGRNQDVLVAILVNISRRKPTPVPDRRRKIDRLEERHDIDADLVGLVARERQFGSSRAFGKRFRGHSHAGV